MVECMSSSHRKCVPMKTIRDGGALVSDYRPAKGGLTSDRSSKEAVSKLCPSTLPGRGRASLVCSNSLVLLASYQIHSSGLGLSCHSKLRKLVILYRTWENSSDQCRRTRTDATPSRGMSAGYSCCSMTGMFSARKESEYLIYSRCGTPAPKIQDAYDRCIGEQRGDRGG